MEVKMGETGSTLGGEEKCIQVFSLNPERGREGRKYLEYLDTNLRMLLKCILRRDRMGGRRVESCG